MRSVVVDTRSQIPVPSPAWVLYNDVSVSGGEVVVNSSGSYAASGLFPVYPSTRAEVAFEVFIPEGGDNRCYSETSYYGIDRKTPAYNTSGYAGNGNSTVLTAGTWRSFKWSVPLGPDIHWMLVRVRINSAYGTPGTRYRNFDLTLIR